MQAMTIILRLLVGLGVAAAVVGGAYAYRIYYDRKVPNFEGRMELYVYPGMAPEAVVLGRIERDMDKYFRAFNLIGLNDLL